MQTLLKDLRYALRQVVNRPGFAIVVVITLGLTVGANTAIFSIVDAVLLRPLPYRDADRLAKVFETSPQRGTRLYVSLGDFNNWKSQCQSFEDMAAASSALFRVGGSTPEEVAGSRVSPNFFRFLGVAPAVGRDFLTDDVNGTGTNVAILTHNYWQSHFGADPNVINRTIVLDQKPHRIVGVLPASFREAFESFPGSAEIWTAVTNDDSGTGRGPGGFKVIARLKPGVSLEQSRAEMAIVAERLEASQPETNTGISANVFSLHEEVTNSSRRSLIVLFAAVGFVLLIACANIASLLLAQSVERSKEVAIRLAIGAGRGRVIRQLLTESLLLSFFGAVLGWFLAMWILRAILPLIPPNLPRADEITLDYRSLVFTVGLCLLTTLLFGLSPAVNSVRVRFAEALKDSGRTASEKLQSRRLRRTLIVVQVGLTTVLLIGAGLLTNSLIRLYRVDPGFDVGNLLSARLRVPRQRGEIPQHWNIVWNSLIQSSAGIPGTNATALVSPVPLGDSYYNMKIRVGSSEHVGGDIVAGYNTVSANYFRVVGIRLLEGREFSFEDKPESDPVVLVNDKFARTYFPNQSAVGKKMILARGSESEKPATIIGVVADSRIRLDQQTEPHFYQLMTQFPQPSMYLLARTNTDPNSYFGSLRSVVAALNPNQVVTEATTMRKLWSEYTVRPRFYLSLLAGLALLGLTLAWVGIYGLLSHNVSQMTHAIGIRRALGAHDGHLLRIVVGQGMTLSTVGVVIGLIGGALLTQLIKDWLFEVGTTDPITYAIVASSLLSIAFIASYFPARRATKVDPLVALRRE